jgi:tRNA A37 methylthiotransferase MiaB
MAEHPKVCTHLHVPMQSGDAGILKAMGRHYGPDGYARSIGYAQDLLGDVLNVTTDVIIGFPGETDEAFAGTAALCESLGITKVHAFPFSARPGTQAYDLEQSDLAVPPEVKKRRSAELRHEAEARLARRSQGLVGSTVQVVAEAGRGHGAILSSEDQDALDTTQSQRAGRGYAADYTPVRLLSPAENGQLVTGTVIAAGPDGHLIVQS